MVLRERSRPPGRRAFFKRLQAFSNEDAMVYIGRHIAARWIASVSTWRMVLRLSPKGVGLARKRYEAILHALSNRGFLLSS